MATALLRIAAPTPRHQQQAAALNVALARQRELRIAAGTARCVGKCEIAVRPDELAKRLEIATMTKRFMEDEQIESDDDGAKFSEIFNRIEDELLRTEAMRLVARVKGGEQ